MLFYEEIFTIVLRIPPQYFNAILISLQLVHHNHLLRSSLHSGSPGTTGTMLACLTAYRVIQLHMLAMQCQGSNGSSASHANLLEEVVSQIPLFNFVLQSRPAAAIMHLCKAIGF